MLQSTQTQNTDHNTVWLRYPVLPGVELCVRKIHGEVIVYYFLENDDLALVETQPRETARFRRRTGLALPFGKG